MLTAPHYPLFLNLAQQPVLVVGGGSVGLRKTQGLVECAAHVTVVSPALAAGFEKLAGIERIAGPYAESHMALRKWRLVFAAANVPEVNATVQRHASAAGILCSRADEPDDGDFTSAAHARVGGITVAIATNGASPLLAARICKQVAAGIDATLSQLAVLLAQWRPIIKQTIDHASTRRALLQRLAGEELETILRTDGEAAAHQTFTRWHAEAIAASAAAVAPQEPPAKGHPPRVVKHAH